MTVSGGRSISILFTCIEHIDIRLLNGTGLILSPNSPLISDELSHIEFNVSTAGAGDDSYKKIKNKMLEGLKSNYILFNYRYCNCGCYIVQNAASPSFATVLNDTKF